MRKIFLVLIVSLFSFSVSFAIEKWTWTYNWNICEISWYSKEKITKILCYSNNEEKLKQELDLFFYNKLKDNEYYIMQEWDLLIPKWKKALEELEEYKESYDNYNYYKGQLSLFVWNAYYRWYKILDNNNEWWIPDNVEAEKYFKIYEDNKDYELKRSAHLFFLTKLNSTQEDFIENIVNWIYNDYKEKKINILELEEQVEKKAKLVEQINELIKEQKWDIGLYALYHLRNILQNELYIYFVNIYKTWDYNKIIKEFDKYMNSFTYIDNDIYSLKNDTFLKLMDIVFDSYNQEIKTSKDKTKLAKEALEKYNIIWNIKWYINYYRAYNFVLTWKCILINEEELEPKECIWVFDYKPIWTEFLLWR